MIEQDTKSKGWEMVEGTRGEFTLRRIHIHGGCIYQNNYNSMVFVPEEDEDSVVHKLTALLVSLMLVSALAIVSLLTGKYLLHIFTS
jgi:hypothetical protein